MNPFSKQGARSLANICVYVRTHVHTYVRTYMYSNAHTLTGDTPHASCTLRAENVLHIIQSIQNFTPEPSCWTARTGPTYTLIILIIFEDYNNYTIIATYRQHHVGQPDPVRPQSPPVLVEQRLCVCVRVCVCVCVRARARVRACLRACVLACLRVYVCACVHAYMRARACMHA